MFEKEAEGYTQNKLIDLEDFDNYQSAYDRYENGVQDAFKDGAEFGYNRAKWHDLRKDPKDLPQCDENTQLIFYVKDWGAKKNDYYYHFALGFYRPAFAIDGKLFLEEGRGYSCEHSPEHVIMWKELVKPEVEEK
jgi:hypothetical protein